MSQHQRMSPYSKGLRWFRRKDIVGEHAHPSVPALPRRMSATMRARLERSLATKVPGTSYKSRYLVTLNAVCKVNSIRYFADDERHQTPRGRAEEGDWRQASPVTGDPDAVQQTSGTNARVLIELTADYTNCV